MVVEKKKPVNLAFPQPIADLFDVLTADMHGKQKWVVMTAALLMFAEASPETRAVYMREVLMSDMPGHGFGKLIGRIREGDVRKEAEPDIHKLRAWYEKQTDLVKSVVMGAEVTPETYRVALMQLMDASKAKKK